MPWTPWRKMSSASLKASTIEVLPLDHLQQPVVLDHDQRVDALAQVLDALLGLLAHAGAPRRRKAGSRRRRSAPRSSSCASSATIGAPPVPVPPPSPAVMKIMSAPLRASLSSSRLSWAAARPTSGFAPAPSPFVPSCRSRSCGPRRHEERLGIGVDRDELDACEAGVDHPRHRVRAAAADSDDLDHGEVIARLTLHSQAPRPQALLDGAGSVAPATVQSTRLRGACQPRMLRSSEKAQPQPAG